MNNELLLLNKKPTDTLIEQTKTKAQETLEFVMNKQTQTYSFNPPTNLVEEGKWLLGVTYLIVQILCIIQLMKTIFSQLPYQDIGTLNLLKKLLTN